MRPPEAGEFREQWKEYRRRRNLVIAVFLGYVPIGIAFGAMTQRVYGSSVPSLVVAIVWLGLLLATLVRSASWPCPRCGRSYSGFWAKACQHCGLTKFAGK
jgi:hypothetical protein